MTCVSCGSELAAPADPTARYVVCEKCSTRNDLAGVQEQTVAGPKRRPASRRARMHNLVGSTLGNGMYRVDSEIGGGGMAKVYCATQIRLDRKVAIKVLPHELTDDASFVQRFRREATVLAKFSHAHIVPVFDTGEEGGIHYIVMGYIEGPDGKAATLRDLLDSKPLEPQQAIRVMEQCLSALEYAHEKSIIHRDIKPGNILIDGRGDAHLADFGIASTRGGKLGDATITVSGSTLGTARYMAPEQSESASQADARSDIYSMGLVFYEMLVGYVPEAKTFLPGDLLTNKKQSKKAFVLPSAAKPGQIDPQLDEVILRAIQPDPADRFQTAGEMLAALRKIAGEPSRGVSRRRGGKRRSRLPLVAAAIAVLVLLVAGGLYYQSNRMRIPGAMLSALKSGESEAAIAYIDKQPDVINRTDSEGMTPLHHAAAQNLSAVALHLIEKGAKIEAQDLKGRTPLHVAAVYNRPALAVLLLEHGAREEAQDNNNKTPYQLAKENNQTEVRLVFERSDLIRAIAAHDLPTIDRLVTPELAKSASEEGWTALHYAAYKGDDYTTRQLLDKGARVDAQTTREYDSDVRYEAGRTPLLLASEFGKNLGGQYPVVVQQFLEHGAIVDLADAKGRTALHYAARNGDANIAKLLVEKSTPNLKTRDEGDTPLHLAAQSGNIEVVNLLLTHSADPAALDAKGESPLQLAAAAGNVDVVKLLLPLGVSSDIRIAARKAAQDAKHPSVVTAIDQWWTGELFSSVDRPSQTPDSIKHIAQLLKWPRPHPAATTRPSDGASPLALALQAAQPSVDLVDLLVTAEPTMVLKPDTSGESPLFMAIRTRRPEPIIALLAGAAGQHAVSSIDPRGLRLLNVAVSTGAVALVDLFISKYQLDPNAADAQHTTPLEIAAERGDAPMVQALLAKGATPDIALLDSIYKSQSSTTEPSHGDLAQVLKLLSVNLLTRQLQDPQTTDAKLSESLTKLDEYKIDLLDSSLPDGQMPLEIAIRNGSPDARRILIDRAKSKPILNQPNSSGETALHIAAQLGQLDTIKQLLADGADYSIKDAQGHTAEDVAKAAQKPDAAALLAAPRIESEKKLAAAKDALNAALTRAVDAEHRAAAARDEAYHAQNDVAAAQQASKKASDAAAEAKSMADLAKTWGAQFPSVADTVKDVADHANAAKKAAADAARFADQALHAGDARIADAWFKNICDKNGKLNINIDGVGKLISHWNIGGRPTWSVTSVDCSGGIFTVITENGVLRNIGDGDVRKDNRTTTVTRIVGHHTEYIVDRKHHTQTPVTVNDTVSEEVPIVVIVHTYSGRLIPKPNETFEWQVGDKTYSVSAVE